MAHPLTRSQRSSRSGGGGGGRGGGARPAARSSAPASAPARAGPVPQRAAPSAATAAQQQQAHSSVPATIPQSQGPGIMGQIAANAASMTIASTAARGISHAMGWGGGYAAAAPAGEQAAAPQTVQDSAAYAGGVQAYGQQPMQSQQQQGGPAVQCEYLAKDFRDCLSATKGDPSPCQYYL